MKKNILALLAMASSSEKKLLAALVIVSLGIVVAKGLVGKRIMLSVSNHKVGLRLTFEIINFVIHLIIAVHATIDLANIVNA